MKFRVMAMSRDATAGIGESEVSAQSRQEAKETFANDNGTTLTALEAAGMSVIAEQI